MRWLRYYKALRTRALRKKVRCVQWMRFPDYVYRTSWCSLVYIDGKGPLDVLDEALMLMEYFPGDHESKYYKEDVQ